MLALVAQYFFYAEQGAKVIVSTSGKHAPVQAPGHATNLLAVCLDFRAQCHRTRPVIPCHLLGLWPLYDIVEHVARFLADDEILRLHRHAGIVWVYGRPDRGYRPP